MGLGLLSFSERTYTPYSKQAGMSCTVPIRVLHVPTIVAREVMLLNVLEGEGL